MDTEIETENSQSLQINNYVMLFDAVNFYIQSHSFANDNL